MFKIHRAFRYRVSIVNNIANTPNTYDNSSASAETSSRLRVKTMRPASPAARSAIPPPKAHQNALNERSRPHNNQLTLADEASHAVVTPRTIPDRISIPRKTAAAAAVPRNPTPAPSAPALRAVLRTDEGSDEAVKPKSDSRHRRDESAPRRGSEFPIQPLAREKSRERVADELGTAPEGHSPGASTSLRRLLGFGGHSQRRRPIVRILRAPVNFGRKGLSSKNERPGS